MKLCEVSVSSVRSGEKGKNMIKINCMKLFKFKKMDKGCRKDGSAGKNTRCTSKRPGFRSQHPHGAFNPSVTPILGVLTLRLAQALN